MTQEGKLIVEINNSVELTDEQADFVEAQMEWFSEAKGEGMTWKQIAKHFDLCMYQTKKFFKGK